MKNTQKQRVKEKLLADGEVTNVWAIQHQMLRLGAIINVLRAEGWVIDGDYLPGTKNWQYTLRDRPKRPKSVFTQFRLPDGRVVVRETKVLV